MPCPRCIRHCRKPGVPSLWSRNIPPLLMMCIGTSDELGARARNGRVLRACSATRANSPSAACAAPREHLCSCCFPCRATLPYISRRSLSLSLPLSVSSLPCQPTRTRPHGLGEPCSPRQVHVRVVFNPFQLVKYGGGCRATAESWWRLGFPMPDHINAFQRALMPSLFYFGCAASSHSFTLLTLGLPV